MHFFSTFSRGWISPPFFQAHGFWKTWIFSSQIHDVRASGKANANRAGWVYDLILSAELAWCAFWPVLDGVPLFWRGRSLDGRMEHAIGNRRLKCMGLMQGISIKKTLSLWDCWIWFIFRTSSFPAAFFLCGESSRIAIDIRNFDENQGCKFWTFPLSCQFYEYVTTVARICRYESSLVRAQSTLFLLKPFHPAARAWGEGMVKGDRWDSTVTRGRWSPHMWAFKITTSIGIS